MRINRSLRRRRWWITFSGVLNVQFVFAFLLSSWLLEMFDDPPPIIYNLRELNINRRRFIFRVFFFLSLFSPLIDAVRVQLYNIANSPNTRPGPIVVKTLLCLLTSTVPSVNEYFMAMKSPFECRMQFFYLPWCTRDCQHHLLWWSNYRSSVRVDTYNPQWTWFDPFQDFSWNHYWEWHHVRILSS